MKYLLVIFLLTISWASCTHEKQAVDCNAPSIVSFQQHIQPIFNQHCATSGCHAGSNPSGNLNLESAVAYAQLTRKGKGYIDTLTTLNGGVFASNDKGNNWTNFNDANTLNIRETITLNYNATTNELAVVNKNGIFILANASTTTTLAYVLSQTGLATGTAIRSISNNGTNWYLATDKGLFSSTTGAMSWTNANSGLKTTDIMVVVPFRTSLVVGTNKEGVFKSPSNAIAWADNNVSFNNIVTYSMETSGVAVVVAATEKGVFVSTDLAATYVRSNKGLTDSLNVTYLKFLGSTLYASTKNGGVFASSDTGKTWVAVNSGLTSLNIVEIFASATNVYVLDANNNLFQAVGLAWTPIQTGLPNNAVPTSMTFYGSKMLVGTLGQGVFSRDILSGTWTAANTGLTNLKVTSVTTNGPKIFAGTEGSGVFVSDITTVNWKQAAPVSIEHTVLMGLDGTKIQDLAFYGGYVFASYKGGLLATSDNGMTWIAGGNQFNLPSYTNVNKIGFVTTRVFVTTENNALYSNSLSELPIIISGVNDVNAALNADIKISPNPNNGSFSIDLTNLKATANSVSVYDNVGKLIERLTVNASDIMTVSTHYPVRDLFSANQYG